MNLPTLYKLRSLQKKHKHLHLATVPPGIQKENLNMGGNWIKQNCLNSGKKKKKVCRRAAVEKHNQRASFSPTITDDLSHSFREEQRWAARLPEHKYWFFHSWSNWRTAKMWAYLYENPLLKLTFYQYSKRILKQPKINAILPLIKFLKKEIITIELLWQLCPIKIPQALN